jgi:hypothetical protein
MNAYPSMFANTYTTKNSVGNSLLMLTGGVSNPKSLRRAPLCQIPIQSNPINSPIFNQEITTMQRTIIAFLSTLVLSTLVAPIANATQVPPGTAPEVANQLAQSNPNERLPFHVREYLHNEKFGR